VRYRPGSTFRPIQDISNQVVEITKKIGLLNLGDLIDVLFPYSHLSLTRTYYEIVGWNCAFLPWGNFNRVHVSIITLSKNLPYIRRVDFM